MFDIENSSHLLMNSHYFYLSKSNFTAYNGSMFIDRVSPNDNKDIHKLYCISIDSARYASSSAGEPIEPVDTYIKSFD